MQLVLATNNPDKMAEIKRLLDDLPVTVLTREDFLEFPDPEETGQTLRENALIKARTIGEFTGLPALAEDTGLEVDALDGAPGVYSSRYAGPDATYDDNCRKLLASLEGVPPGERTARFRCVAVVWWGENDYDVAEGVAEGFITTEKGGEGGFGYDPVFYYPPLQRRFSELTMDEKNRVSHRGRALQQVRDLILQRLRRTVTDGRHGE